MLRRLPLREFTDLERVQLTAALDGVVNGDMARFEAHIADWDPFQQTMMRALVDQTLVEELRQRALPKREFPYATWHPEIRLFMEKVLPAPAGEAPEPQAAFR